MSDTFSTEKLTQWLRPKSAVERARGSEEHFVLRLALLVVLFVVIGAAGVLRVKRMSIGVRTAYELVRTNDELRMQLDENRRLEAQLTGMKNPNLLHKEAADHFDMRPAGTEDIQEVE